MITDQIDDSKTNLKRKSSETHTSAALYENCDYFEKNTI